MHVCIVFFRRISSTQLFVCKLHIINELKHLLPHIHILMYLSFAAHTNIKFMRQLMHIQ